MWLSIANVWYLSPRTPKKHEYWSKMELSIANLRFLIYLFATFLFRFLFYLFLFLENLVYSLEMCDISSKTWILIQGIHCNCSKVVQFRVKSIGEVKLDHTWRTLTSVRLFLWNPFLHFNVTKVLDFLATNCVNCEKIPNNHIHLLNL